MSNRVLVVGAPGVGKTFLIENTKYYTADVSLTSTSTDVLDASAETVEWPKELRQLGDGLQALVLVYDVLRPETFGLLEPWATEFVATFEPSVLLCVANCVLDVADGGVLPRPVLERMDGEREWALDHGIEFVEAAYDRTWGLSEEEVASGGLTPPPARVDGETVGTARVTEALQCHMWADMNMKARGASSARPSGPSLASILGGSYQPSDSSNPLSLDGSAALSFGELRAAQEEDDEDEAKEEDSGGEEEEEDVAEPEQPEPAPTPTVTTFDESGRMVVEVGTDVRVFGPGLPPDMVRARAEQAARQRTNDNADPFALKEPTDDMDRFMGMMEKMKRVRAEASSLPDNLRRERAESTLREFIELVGDDDSDETMLQLHEELTGGGGGGAAEREDGGGAEDEEEDDDDDDLPEPLT